MYVSVHFSTDNITIKEIWAHFSWDIKWSTTRGLADFLPDWDINFVQMPPALFTSRYKLCSSIHQLALTTGPVGFSYRSRSREIPQQAATWDLYTIMTLWTNLHIVCCVWSSSVPGFLTVNTRKCQDEVSTWHLSKGHRSLQAGAHWRCCWASCMGRLLQLIRVL